MGTLLSVISCLCGRDGGRLRRDPEPAQSLISVKPRPHRPPMSGSPPRSAETVVADVLFLLRTAQRDDAKLAERVDDTVGAEGWTEWIAERVLSGVKAILERGWEKMGSAMKAAGDRASEAAEALFCFTDDHPEVVAGMLTIIAVGVLVMLAPMFVEALGFAELGPIEGSFAAGWESTYAGYIPKGSLFSFFQRLGMIWGRT